ncbi:GNAT family N-acetyltransferase [Halococcus hamelinensis]|uniref:Sporulation regulator-like protein n=1 Tax=Halococcus hamelinensis 100A6 TaxID=1132509 RepID=M0LY52_9EURY|nr:GNAT family N-acetyltransferase [Halococcus hamelinensis]EMA38386.1 sporulation regulator-like protein [Halococcus hamelinensis 100A6]
MNIESPSTEAADAIADMWVELARGQRAHGSHLHAEENRRTIREAVVRDIITDGLLVARDEAGDLAGFVMFGPESEQYAQDVSRGIVRNLVVRPERRDEGIGGALLDAAENALRAEGFDVVSLSVLADNDGARRFYERHGYTPQRLDLEKRLESDSHKSTGW